MMSMSAINSIEYYTNLAREDYYLEGGEPEGYWSGLGAQVLDLRGAIKAEDLRLLMDGFDQAGQPISANAGAPDRRCGLDLCFAPPKSVSLAWARASGDLQKQFGDAHAQAVRAAIRHLEQHAAWTRRGHDGQIRERVTGIIAATFEHCTSRAMDPQLHTHALILNLAPRDDGTWGGLESRDFFLWQKAIGAVYSATLAFQLRNMGFELNIDDRGQSFELKEIPTALCRHFSKRTQQIEEALAERGLKTSASAAGDVIKLSTRDQKTSIDRAQLQKLWHAEMDNLGFTHEALMATRTEHAARREQYFELSLSPLLEPDTLLEQITEKRAVFEERAIYQRAAELALLNGETSSTAEAVARDAILSEDAVDLGRDYRHNRLFTTKSQLAFEKQVISSVKRMRAQTGYDLADATLEKAMHEHHKEISEEQAEAILAVCQAQRFAILQGSAGAGKSTAMSCVRQAYSQSGYTVIGAAVAKSAAENLAREAGMATSTIAKLLCDLERGRATLTDKTVLILDEAGQVSTPQLVAITRLALEGGAKVILVGEDKQLDSIEHGGMLRYLSRPEILGASRVETIRRQHEPWARQAVADLRDGRAISALQAHHERGLVHFSPNQEEAHAALVASWNEHRLALPDSRLLVLAQRWRDVHLLSERIRDIHRAEGTLAAEGVVVRCVVGDQEVLQELSIGERVRFTRNDYRLGLTNGATGRLVDFREREGDMHFWVEDDFGQTKHFSLSEYCDDFGRLSLVHAYATTVYSSQGLTVDETFVLHDVQMDRATGYVAGSRHRRQCRWFGNCKALDELIHSKSDAERLECMAKSMSEDRYQSLAIERLERVMKARGREFPESIVLS